MSKKIGLYLHIPFCDGKCPYCDFYSRRGSGDVYDRFLAAMIRGVFSAPASEGTTVDTIYFGGGTPVLLGARRLLSLLSAVQQRFGKEQREITLEANPGAVNPAMLKALREGGFTRISFGVQSLCDETLKTLGRKHDAARALAAISEAKQAGFLHISADLMLAVPGQTIEEITQSIATLGQSSIDHLSAYLLKLEPGTAFAAHYDEADEDFAADCYRAMVEGCKQSGFLQYEISNFAKSPDARGQHNLTYWYCGEYLGLGPAAHSFLGGKRFCFPRALDEFLAAEHCWQLVEEDGTGGDEEERLMLGLRLSEGIAVDSLSAERRTAMQRAVPPLEKAGLLRAEGGRIALTVEGFLVSNAVIAALLAL